MVKMLFARDERKIEIPTSGKSDVRVIGSSLSITHAGQIWQSVSFKDEK